MVEAIIFFILGSILSWCLSHYYYKRSNRETPNWFSIENIKEIITKNPQNINWTAKQIVNLYNKKIFGKESTGDPFSFNFCPSCGSEKLKQSSAIDYEGDEMYFFISCRDCNWSSYSQ